MFNLGKIFDSNDKVLLLNYEPKTNIIDHSRIDLDQKEIEKDLAQRKFLSALSIYIEGAYSGAYSTLTLTSQNFISSARKGTSVAAITVDGKKQRGNLYESVGSTATSIQVQYETSIGCANVRDKQDPSSDISGCFSEAGQISLDVYSNIDWNVTYQYDIREDTRYSRSLQKLRADAESNMPLSSEHDHYLKFLNYYGQSDYANQWILAAFNSGNTNFDNGNADFSSYSEVGRIEAITKATRNMSILMHVIDEIEDAIYDCFTRCTILGCGSNKGTSSWDKAVALYVGSQEDGQGGGYMPYAFANDECQNFATCDLAAAAGQQARVNLEIMDQFVQGQRRLTSGQCYAAKKNKERIVQLTAVPLVQGTLRRAHQDMVYENDDDNDTVRIEANQAEGAVLAASVLPLIHACNKDDARTIHDNMKESAEEGLAPNFADVKVAFENNYQCLGITCEDVGGLVDTTIEGQYLFGAQPCVRKDVNGNIILTRGGKKNNSDRMNSFKIYGLVILVVVIVFFFFRVIWKNLVGRIGDTPEKSNECSSTEEPPPPNKQCIGDSPRTSTMSETGCSDDDFCSDSRSFEIP